MTKRGWTIAGCSLFAAVCLVIAVSFGLEVAKPVVASGEIPTASGILATLLPLLGTFGGTVGAIVAFLSKAGGSIGPIINGAGGQHAVVLGAIFSALQVAGGKAANSEGSATLNGGTLKWSFTFTPDAKVNPQPLQGNTL